MTVSCKECLGTGLEPNRMLEFDDGPLCSCGKPSRLQSGMCSYECEGGECILCSGRGKYLVQWTLTCEGCGRENLRLVGKTPEDKLVCRLCHYRNSSISSELLDSDEYRERVLSVDMENRRVARSKIEVSLFEGIKQRHDELSKLLEDVNKHWTYEDGIYRFYHHSFKVYGRLQGVTEEIVETLRSLVPPEATLNKLFLEIFTEGTGKTFSLDHNAEWSKHTRPIVEAFLHAKFFLEMAVKYGEELKDREEPPSMLPSGWAALLHLFRIR